VIDSFLLIYQKRKRNCASCNEPVFYINVKGFKGWHHIDEETGDAVRHRCNAKVKVYTEEEIKELNRKRGLIP
jgi:hypothetical protein